MTVKVGQLRSWRDENTKRQYLYLILAEISAEDAQFPKEELFLVWCNSSFSCFTKKLICDDETDVALSEIK